jgi:hypothetical protein
MDKWSKKHKKCISCLTNEWAHKAHGYCMKCHPLIIKKEIIKNWDPINPKTLIPIGPMNSKMFPIIIKMNELNKVKKRFIQQIDARLYLYEKYNSPGKVDPIAIEYLLERIADITNNLSHSKLFHGAVTGYQRMSNGDRQIIYKDLAFILINREFSLTIGNLNAN